MKQCVLVSGDFTTFGGMDRANYELAWHLAERAGVETHIVAHHVQPPLAEHRNVVLHLVKKPLNSYTLAEGALRRAGRRVARALPDARVIVNGGNCDWPDVNWVHALHAAWDCRDDHAPLLFRARAHLQKQRNRAGERKALRAARIIVTNSHRTRRQIIDLLGVDPQIVHTVYYGIDADVFAPVTPEQQRAAREALSLPVDREVIAFIGALGLDRNKGFDTLFRAQQKLCEGRDWSAMLVAAGAGREVEHWRRQAERAGLSDRVRMLGFTKHAPDLLAAADVLVAPSSYESYGLAIHEALCREIPAIVSNVAGIAERYPPELRGWLLADPTDADALARVLRTWRDQRELHRAALTKFAAELRGTSWQQMAECIVKIIESRDIESPN